ncbi:hypothetical protein Tco_0480795 [Tanacetum coccineum]
MSLNTGSNNASNSYAHAVKVGPKSVEAEVDNIPALVLDEDCLNQQEYSNSLLGKVKELNTLSNLKMVLVNKGLDNIDIKVCWIRTKEVPRWTPEFVENNEDADTDNESYEWDSIGEKGGLNGTSNLEGESDCEEVPETKFAEGLHKSNSKEVEGFEKFVEETWNEAPVDKSNDMINLMKKLKYLKEKIRVVNSLQELDKLQALEAAQKAKIKWAIEGDENSKYYHGILNKKRN